jgi:hypothetical protein
MTVVGLLLIGVFVGVAQRTWRNNQRRTDLATVEAMVQRYAEGHRGRYPAATEADNASSEFRDEFNGLKLADPKSGKYYVLGSDFGPCDPTADATARGPGYISYGRPGNGGPFKLRICLEWGGEFGIGD